MSAAGKKRQFVGSSGGKLKRATVNPSCKASKFSSLNSFFAQMEKVRDSRVGSRSEAALHAVEVECGGRKEDEAIDPSGMVVLDDSADEADLVCFKRKRSLRLRSHDQVSPIREHVSKGNAGSCRKRRRPEVSQKLGKQEKEPSVILAWKQWCMYEGEDGEELETLINKRDERRRLERQMELLRQESERAHAVTSIKSVVPGIVMAPDAGQVAAECREEVMREESQTLERPKVTGSCASHTDKRAAAPGALPLPSVSEDQLVQVISGDGAEGSNTPAGIDSKLGGSLGREAISDSDIEFASGESRLGDGLNPTTTQDVGARDMLGEDVGIESRAGSTQVLVSGDQQTDPTFFSAQGDSMVLDPGAEGITANLKNGARTSDESISQSTLNDICTKPKANAADKGEGVEQGGTSCCGELREELIVELNDEDDRVDGVEPTLDKVIVVVGDTDRGLCNATESLHQLHASLPSSSRIEQDRGQSSEQTVPGVATYPRHQIFEEQGESTGGPNEGAYGRGKQKVIELSDEEEDSNRISIERRAVSGQQSYYVLDGQAHSNGDGGAGTTSGAEISSVYFGGRFASGASQYVPEEPLAPVENENADGGAVESIAPYQASRESDEELETPEQVRTYRRRSRRQDKAIAGEDSGEEVRGPVARANGESSDVDSHEGQLGGDGPPKDPIIYCPVCNKKLSRGISNVKINTHIDKCLSRM